MLIYLFTRTYTYLEAYFINLSIYTVFLFIRVESSIYICIFVSIYFNVNTYIYFHLLNLIFFVYFCNWSLDICLWIHKYAYLLVYILIYLCLCTYIVRQVGKWGRMSYFLLVLFLSVDGAIVSLILDRNVFDIFLLSLSHKRCKHEKFSITTISFHFGK